MKIITRSYVGGGADRMIERPSGTLPQARVAAARFLRHCRFAGCAVRPLSRGRQWLIEGSPIYPAEQLYQTLSE